MMLRRFKLRPSVRSDDAVLCVLLFPDSAEYRWLNRLPAPGTRVRSRLGAAWIVDEVLQSGRETYTVFCLSRRDYVDRLRHRSDRPSVLAGELMEAARHTSEIVTERKRRWKLRHYLP